MKKCLHINSKRPNLKNEYNKAALHFNLRFDDSILEYPQRVQNVCQSHKHPLYIMVGNSKWYNQ